ncbi:MARCO-like protein [Castor canadensis]|uniref:MARCO-like protein n=1 Tax=Castor canadensis TaxID=51338 RepID=A0AC58MPV7_CASCN
MGAFIFLPFMFLSMFSVSSDQISKPNVFKLEENQEPALIHLASHARRQKESNRQGNSHAQGMPGVFTLQGRPGYPNQPGTPRNSNQQRKPEVLIRPAVPGAWILQGKPGSSSQQGKPGSSSQQGKPGSSSQQGEPESSSQQGKPGSSSQQGKPGSSSQQGKPGSSNHQRKPRSFYKQGERKNVANTLNGNKMDIQAGSISSKSPIKNKICESVYKPVCGSDGITYGNLCLFKEAKRLSNGKLILNHEGKC